MRAIIHNIDKESAYIVNNENECRDDTDKSAYRIFLRFGETICMGKVIVEKANN